MVPRYRQPEDRALRLRGLESDITAETGRGAADDCQTEPRARLADRLFAAEEVTKELGAVGLVDPRPTVAHANDDVVFLLRDRDVDLGSTTIPDRIVDQIADRFLKRPRFR